jgi:tetratricopeptide (TPR) repeat protein
MIAVDDKAIQNQRNLRRLVMSIQASYGKLNLLIAICDNRQYRDELIRNYETELIAKGVRCDRVRIDRSQPSLKQSLQELTEKEPDLRSSEVSALVTILGADELLGIRLNDPKSAQEQFFFSLQWTREGLREFKFPIVIWLTSNIADALAQQAPDFWSWRGGVFEFSQPIETVITPIERGNDDKDKSNEKHVKTDTIALQKQIDEMQSQDLNSPLLASLYNSLGQAYQDAIRYREAEDPYQKALELYKKQFGDKHPSVATSINNLAVLYSSQGRYAEAEPLYKQSLALSRELFGSSHPDIATSLNNLAVLYYSQGRYAEAEPLYKQALAMYQELLGDRHLSFASTINNLAELYRLQGRYVEAEPLYKQALLLRQELLGVDGASPEEARHPDVTTSLNNLALLYSSQGRYAEAEPLHKQVLLLTQELLGDRHPYVAQSLNSLAWLYYSQGRYAEAEPLYKQALLLRQELLGEKHPSVASSLFNLSVLYHNMDSPAESLKLIQRAIQIYNQTLGVDHPETKAAQSWLPVIKEKAKGKKREKEKRGFGVRDR